MAKKGKIRLAVVRCDSHAYWYGPFLDECDLFLLSQSSAEAPTRPGVHYYFQRPGDPRHLKIKRLPGFVISKVFDRIPECGVDKDGIPKLQYGTYPGRAKAFAETFLSHPQVCETIEEAAQDVDAAFISNSSSPTDGADHLELARPFLERGIPCFIDKPFAATLTGAREMIRLAKKHKTVLMNASLLEYTDAGKNFRQRFVEVGRPGILVVKGVGFHNGAIIHGIALAHAMFGYGVEAVECMGACPKEGQTHWNGAMWSHYVEHILFHYPDGRQAMVMNTTHDWTTEYGDFYCSVYGKLGVIHSAGIDNREYLTSGPPIIGLFRQMIKTGKPPIPYEHILERIAIIEAARLAQKKGRRVALKEVWNRSDSLS